MTSSGKYSNRASKVPDVLYFGAWSTICRLSLSALVLQCELALVLLPLECLNARVHCFVGLLALVELEARTILLFKGFNACAPATHVFSTSGSITCDRGSYGVMASWRGSVFVGAVVVGKRNLRLVVLFVGCTTRGPIWSAQCWLIYLIVYNNGGSWTSRLCILLR